MQIPPDESCDHSRRQGTTILENPRERVQWGHSPTSHSPTPRLEVDLSQTRGPACFGTRRNTPSSLNSAENCPTPAPLHGIQRGTLLRRALYIMISWYQERFITLPLPRRKRSQIPDHIYETFILRKPVVTCLWCEERFHLLLDRSKVFTSLPLVWRPLH